MTARTNNQTDSPRGGRWVAVNVSRLLLAVVFIVSGFVKAVDPLGTQYKIQEYLHALGAGTLVPDMATLAASVGQSAVEFCLGIFLLFSIRRRFTSKAVLLIMVVMTPLTLWLALAEPVSDCGCFGDALVLTNWQTFWKNVVLLAASVAVALWPQRMFRFISETNQWIVINYSVLFILATSLWSLYSLPVFDFRPYHVGADIRAGMDMPEGAEHPEFETTFILEKDGQQREFTLDDYPDSTWTFVDSRTRQTRQGYVPPIHDFSIVNADGDDIAGEILADSSYTFLLVSPHLRQADDSRLDLINLVYEYACDHGYPFCCITASSETETRRWIDRTGAEYPFCKTDETVLKTIIRSNPGLLLLHDGKVVRKWSHNRLPQFTDDEAAQPLYKLEQGQMPNVTVAGKIAMILLWFVLPLLLLTIADRLWAWSHWVRRKEKDINPINKEKEQL